MEECAKHVTDDDYLMYLRSKGVRNRYPMGLRDLLYYQPQTNGLPVELSMNNYVGDLSVEFLRNHVKFRGDAPFFLWSSCTSPHPPFAPCEPYDSMYDPEYMDLPVNAERPLSDIPSFLWGSRGRLDGAHRDPDRIRRIRALYYGLVSHVDDVFGRIIEEVKALDLWDDTVILFVSDHGDMLGDHGLSQKNCPYEPSVRIPMILRWPGRAESGVVCDDLVGLTDVLPTLVDELDLPHSNAGQLPGDSLLGQNGGGLSEERDAYVIDYGVDRTRWVAIRTRSHMFCIFADGDRRELYDLERDPHEIDNLVNDRSEMAAEYAERALLWERENGLPGSFVDGVFQTFPTPDKIPSEEECRIVSLNEGPWPKRLPEGERDSVETYAEAFTRAIIKETTISPDKLSIGQYKKKYLKLGPTDHGGESLVGTPWEDAWNRA
jgi:choline-sulfatase